MINNTNIFVKCIYRTLCLILLYPLWANGLGISDRSFEIVPKKCERISIPMCKDVPYNATRMPNFIGHYTQGEAAIMVHEFVPLEYLGCSPLLKFYLCSMFAPLCAPSVPDIVPPCRSVCLTVKEACLPVLESFNFTWPHYLECDQLPVSSRGALCMEHPDHSYKPTLGPDHGTRKYMTVKPLPTKGIIQTCRGPQTQVITRTGDHCVPLCRGDFLYRNRDKNMAKIWILIWAVLCLLSSLFTVLTFCLDMTRVKYPERPIIWLAFCYLWYCIPFIARGILSPEILSCETSITGILHLTIGGLRTPGCVVTFILQYYFTLASSVWWLILTLTWLLSSGRYMVSEALQAYSSYFHAAAWGGPAIATILALTLKQVDGDELTGLCMVGSLRPGAYLWFLVIPLSLILLCGTGFIIAGFVALCKIRNAIKLGFLQPTDGQFNQSYQKKMIDLGKFEKLMVRIGVFSGLYTFPALFVIGGHLYQYLQYDSWVQEREQDITTCQARFRPNNYPKTSSRGKGYSNPYQQLRYQDKMPGCELQKSIPYVEMMLLRLFMSLVVGITSGVWVWSSKTVSIWKKFFKSLCCRQQRLQKYHAPIDNAQAIPLGHSHLPHEPQSPPWLKPMSPFTSQPTTHGYRIAQPHHTQQSLLQMDLRHQNRPKKTLNKYSNLRGNTRYSDNLPSSSSHTSQANVSQTAQL